MPPTTIPKSKPTNIPFTFVIYISGLFTSYGRVIIKSDQTTSHWHTLLPFIWVTTVAYLLFAGQEANPSYANSMPAWVLTRVAAKRMTHFQPFFFLPESSFLGRYHIIHQQQNKILHNIPIIKY
jgi:hypothetical protein